MQDRLESVREARGGEVVAVIPARYESTRLPGKPLLDIGGQPLILRVAGRVAEARTISRVIVATDDERIRRVVEEAGYEAMMTSTSHQTGTDRLAEVAARIDAGIIVNIQGDEPLIDPGTIESAIAPLIDDPALVMSTTSEPIGSVADLLSPQVVKVVTDCAGFALCFSRQPIPFPRAAVMAAGSLPAAVEADPALLGIWRKHTGLYAYRRDFLLRYTSWPPTPLEQLESLEQLRVLENGYRLRVIPVAHRSIGVDTPEDLARVRSIFAAGQPGDQQ